jgi:nucleotidyltransferase/DNA polymerase involved in DNA repair
MKRRILRIDMDVFFAAVEQKEDHRSKENTVSSEVREIHPKGVLSQPPITKPGNMVFTQPCT